MVKKELSTEKDVELLIDTFYDKILKHDQLSYFFKDAIHNWSFHKDRFVKYWSAQILFTQNYEGTPLYRHVEVDHRYEKGFTQSAF